VLIKTGLVTMMIVVLSRVFSWPLPNL